jgi:hypothetical protein
MENRETALYVFCFARPELLREVEGTGVDGDHPLSMFRYSPDLCAVLSEVALEDFCGPAAELRMQDLSWVGERALRHEAVVEEALRRSPVLPVRLGTLFSSLKALREFLEEHGGAIKQFLERVVDQREWSVKGLLDRKRALQVLISTSRAAQEKQLAALPAGTRYFGEQRIRQDAEKELSLWLNQTCSRVVSDLRNYASDFRECQVVSGEAAESGATEVVNWAFLLPASATAAFRECLDRVNLDFEPQGLLYILSGPWPPYRFVPSLSIGKAP